MQILCQVSMNYLLQVNTKKLNIALYLFKGGIYNVCSCSQTDDLHVSTDRSIGA